MKIQKVLALIVSLALVIALLAGCSSNDANKAKEAVQEVQQAAEEKAEEVKEEVTEAVEEAKEEVTEAVEEVKEEVTEAAEEATEAAAEIVEEVKEEAVEAVEEAKEAVEEAAATDVKTITVIATQTPHADILELVRDDLKALGYDLEVTVASDYVVENPAVAGGDVLANFFQHVPYLNQYNDSVEDGQKLAGVIKTHFEPMAIYKGTKSSLDELAEGDKIAIPNDPTNMARALLLLQDAGLIKLPEGTGLESVVTKEDIVENAKGIEILESNAEQISGQLADVAFGVINGNYAGIAGLTILENGVFAEPADGLAGTTYVNLFAVKPENENADWVKALEQVIYTEKVYNFLLEGNFVPSFTVEAAE